MKCCQIIEIRHKCAEGATLEGKEVKNTIVLTFAFQVVFTGFNALQNLHSSLHDEESLGNIALAIISSTAIVSSVLSPTIIGLIGAKTAIVAYFAAHAIYVLANYYASFATMAPAAVVLGALQGPAWTSQALYISASAFSFSKSSSASPYSILSRFNVFFFAIFATSQIVGNLVTSTVIKDGVGNSSDDSVEFKYCGPDDCPSSANATKIEDPDDWVIEIILGFFMACALLGFLMVVFLLSALPRSEWIQRVSVRSTATSCFNVLVSTNMMMLVPFMFFTAMQNAFLLSAYTKSYVACPIGIHMVGYVMAVYGATTPFFVFTFSRLTRVAGRFLLLTLSLTTHTVLFMILFLWTPESDDEGIIFGIPVVWGVSESILVAQANSLIAMLFPSQKEPAFANFHAWRSLGYAITFLNASYMCVSTKLIVCMAFGVLGTGLYILVEIRTKLKEKLSLKRSRPSVASIASVPSQVELRRDTTRTSISSTRTSASSLKSIQDRLSFERVELTDIISEAQQGWKRSDSGLTLEVNKVMSMEHLAISKVTNWYHNTSVLSDFANKSKYRLSSHPSGLPRSLSDGHLNYAAVKVDAALFKVRRGRSHTIGVKSLTPNPPLPKRRHVSDINPPTFHVIRDIVYEEDEFTMEDETEIDTYMSPIDTKEHTDYVFDNDDNDISEEEAKVIRDYRNVLRRLSETLNKDSLGRISNPHSRHESDSLSDVSLSSGTQEIQEDQSDDSGSSHGRAITFTCGSTADSESGLNNKAFESDDHDNSFYVREISSYRTRPMLNRSVSCDNDYVIEDTFAVHPAVRRLHGAVKLKSNQERDTHERRSGVINLFKGVKKSNKKNKDATHNSTGGISNGRAHNSGNRESESTNDSDADSDGFINYEQDDNENYLPSDMNGSETLKRKKKIPISETEDVNSIY